MSRGLFHTLNIGSESLFNARQGVDTTGHNIANAQTEGYSRQKVEVEARHPTYIRNLVVGNGARVQTIKRAHNEFLEEQINNHNSQYGMNKEMKEIMDGVEAIYSPELSSSLADEMNSFFNSMQDLAANPTDRTSRVAVRESAENVISTFVRIDNDLQSINERIGGGIRLKLNAVNDSLRNIASLNSKIQNLEVGSIHKANDLLDKRDLMVRNLSEILDVSYYQNDHGQLVLRGPAGELLVEGPRAAQMGIDFDERGDEIVTLTDYDGAITKNITDTLLQDAGSLAGLFTMRQNVIKPLQANNHEMAYRFGSEVNDVHRRGFGIGEFIGTRGRNFFDSNLDINSAATSLKVSDLVAVNPDAIGTGLVANTPGDNVVANELVGLKDKALFENGRMSYTDYYASLVGEIGMESVRIQDRLEADESLKTELANRREAVSGVSLDEEAVNLIKWQTNFTASSKLITTVDEMIQTVLSLKR